MSIKSPQEFINKWQKVTLSERSACQQHFLDLCELLGQPKPAEADPQGAWYTFERGVRKEEGGRGWADVWMRKHFGWEYKGKHKDLNAAYKQLLLYRNDLENPPILVVCDMDRFVVHTNFTGFAEVVHEFDLKSLDRSENLDILRRIFTDPESFKPSITTAKLTEKAAQRFAKLAEFMRKRDIPNDKIAHFLMKLMFCMFAEDITFCPKSSSLSWSKEPRTIPSNSRAGWRTSSRPCTRVATLAPNRSTISTADSSTITKSSI